MRPKMRTERAVQRTTHSDHSKPCWVLAEDLAKGASPYSKWHSATKKPRAASLFQHVLTAESKVRRFRVQPAVALRVRRVLYSTMPSLRDIDSIAIASRTAAVRRSVATVARYCSQIVISTSPALPAVPFRAGGAVSLCWCSIHPLPRKFSPKPESSKCRTLLILVWICVFHFTTPDRAVPIPYTEPGLARRWRIYHDEH